MKHAHAHSHEDADDAGLDGHSHDHRHYGRDATGGAFTAAHQLAPHLHEHHDSQARPGTELASPESGLEACYGP